MLIDQGHTMPPTTTATAPPLLLSLPIVVVVVATAIWNKLSLSPSLLWLHPPAVERESRRPMHFLTAFLHVCLRP